MEKKFKLGVIGAGNMAAAIVNGIISAGILSPSDMIISDVDGKKRAEFSKRGLTSTDSNRLLAANSENVLFAVKPQSAQDIMTEISDCIASDTVISIMAGVPINKLEATLGKRNYARVMPNTPAMVGEGMAAVAFNKGFRSEFVLDVFRSLGKAVELDESLFDAVTSLSGSGPAYVYAFIKALINGGTDGGLDLETAEILALQTVRGAAKMIKVNSDKSIDELIDAVCSKGGTTIQAIESFKADNLDGVIRKGMEKCRKRSEELGKA